MVANWPFWNCFPEKQQMDAIWPFLASFSVKENSVAYGLKKLAFFNFWGFGIFETAYCQIRPFELFEPGIPGNNLLSI